MIDFGYCRYFVFLSQFTPHLSWFCLKIGHPPIFPWQTTAIAWGNVEPTGPDPACTLDVSTVELPASLPISAHDREIRSDFAILAFHKIALHMQIRAFFHSSRLRIFDVFFFRCPCWWDFFWHVHLSREEGNIPTSSCREAMAFVPPVSTRPHEVRLGTFPEWMV